MNKTLTIVSFVLALLIMPHFGAAQQANTSAQTSKAVVTVTGVLTEPSGEPLVGATVLVVGTSNGAITNTKGEYTLKCLPENTLRFSFMGFSPVEELVGSRIKIDVAMSDSSKAIDDIIVIGYGTTTRRRTVGAVDQIKASAIAERSVSNITQALQGTSPSLVIQQRSFDPNDQQLNMNIRGIGTMNDNSPLVVIDGLVSDGGSFNKLNPADIESISVLKDAGTAAIYGSRSANGVLLVSTKKGKANQTPTVRFNGMVGVESPKVLYTPVEGYQNATLYNLYQTNALLEPKFSPAQIRDLKDNGNGKFFLDEILQNAMQQSYNVSVTGGGDNSTYMVSAGYYDQKSNYVGPDYGIKRYNFRTNITTEYKRFKVTALLSYVRENNTSPSAGNIIVDSYRVPTYYYNKLQDPATGKYLTNDVLTQYNPLGMLMEGGFNEGRNDYINPNVAVDYRIIDGLKLRGVFGADIFDDSRYTRRKQVNFYDMNDINGSPRIANSDRDTENWSKKANQLNSQLMLDYDKYFGKHHVSGVVGASNESFTAYETSVRIKLSDPDLGIKGDGSTIDPAGTSVFPEKTTKRSINSIFGRVGYDYQDKYFGEVSFRYDGSSKFNQDERWGFFPSVSAGWRLTAEDFMRGYADKVGDLKIRGSYGVLGNQNVSDYQYFTTYDVYSNTYGFNNKPVAGAGFRLGTENLRWEVSKTFNIGVDASFLSNRLNIGFDYFLKNTSDILVKPQIPLMFGTELQNYNAGKMRTQGWEVTISYNQKTGDFNHTASLNVGDSWNKVVKYEGFQEIIGIEEYWRIMREGLPFNSYYGYKTLGIFQSYDEIANSAVPLNANVQPGDLKFWDRNEDGVIDENDRAYLGNAFPRYTFGFNYGVTYKGFDVSIFLQGVLKRDMMVRGELIEPFHANYGMTMYEHQLDFWTPTNTDAKYPRLVAESAASGSRQNNWSRGSDIYMFDGRYLRLKNVQIGYTLPEKISMKAGMQKVKVYVNAQNLLTFSKNSFLDPEMSEYGTDMNSSGANSGRAYPTLRYFGMGLDIVF